MNVLILPEDFRKDQYILKPLIVAMFKELDIPAVVRVAQRPTFRGVSDALRWEAIRTAIDIYRGMIDLFLLVVDRDCDKNRKQALDAIERRAAEYLKTDRLFLAEHAWQEVEVWALAAHMLPAEWRWADIRAHRDPKEAYFDPLARARGVDASPGGGRKALGEECGRKYRRVRSRCPEDVEELEKRIATLCRR